MAFRRQQWRKAAFIGFLVIFCTFTLYLAGLLPYKPNPDISEEDEPDYYAIPSLQHLHNMTHRQLAEMYHRYITTVQTLCRRVVRLGKLGDGGWEICEDRNFRPANPCLVYSFGINNDFSFDDHIAERLNCEVYSFDPSMTNTADGKRGGRQWFYKTGLHERTMTMPNGWNVKTLNDLLKSYGHTESKIDVLKLDIEKFEWLSLTQIYESGGLHNVKQLLVELHIALVGEPERLEYIQGLGILKFLYDNGFRIVYSHRNLWCKFYSKLRDMDEVGCHEVSFVHIPEYPK